jgi:hypothetical protein
VALCRVGRRAGLTEGTLAEAAGGRMVRCENLDERFRQGETPTAMEAALPMRPHARLRTR